MSGGGVPRGESFSRAVLDLARRAGVDTSPIERPVPRDRRTDLLHDFFTLCRWELAADRGRRRARISSSAGCRRRRSRKRARRRARCGLRPRLPSLVWLLRSRDRPTRECSDSRWPGRLCGGWRDERGRSRTLWARSLDASADDTRYLYLRGVSRGTSSVRTFVGDQGDAAAARHRSRRGSSRRSPSSVPWRQERRGAGRYRDRAHPLRALGAPWFRARYALPRPRRSWP